MNAGICSRQKPLASDYHYINVLCVCECVHENYNPIFEYRIGMKRSKGKELMSNDGGSGGSGGGGVGNNNTPTMQCDDRQRKNQLGLLCIP